MYGTHVLYRSKHKKSNLRKVHTDELSVIKAFLANSSLSAGDSIAELSEILFTFLCKHVFHFQFCYVVRITRSYK